MQRKKMSLMGIHTVRLPHLNKSAEVVTTELPLPEKVVILMAQHGGVPCTPLVKVGDNVKTGQLIGESDALISVPVHSSVTGVVTEITEVLHISGKKHCAVVIQTAENQELCEKIKPPVVNSREEFIKAVRDSGSAGLGGAGFPTYVKLNYDRKKFNIDTLLVNAAECEPYITSDYRTLIEDTDKLIDGIKLIMKYLEIPRAVIGIEADKPKAISKLRHALAKEKGINVKKLASAYPQGAEKVLIYNATGRVLMEGELPASTGCVVLNCSTIAFISDYMKTGIPLIKRRITVDGNIITTPRNVLVPIGTRLADIAAYVNVFAQPERVIFGGPMMGVCVCDIEAPVSKTNNAVLFMGHTTKDVNITPTACIRCGRCTRACSMKLLPTELETAFDNRDAEMLKKLRVNLCMNCGACTYVCPAKRNLSEKNQLAKDYLRALK